MQPIHIVLHQVSLPCTTYVCNLHVMYYSQSQSYKLPTKRWIQNITHHFKATKGAMIIYPVCECSTFCFSTSSGVDSPFHCMAHQGIVGHHHVGAEVLDLVCLIANVLISGPAGGWVFSVNRVRLKVKLKTIDTFNLRWSCSAMSRKDGPHPKTHVVSQHFSPHSVLLPAVKHY